MSMVSGLIEAIGSSEVMFKIKKVNIKPSSDGDAAVRAKEVNCIQSSDHGDHADSSVKVDDVLRSSQTSVFKER